MPQQQNPKLRLESLTQRGLWRLDLDERPVRIVNAKPDAHYMHSALETSFPDVRQTPMNQMRWVVFDNDALHLEDGLAFQQGEFTYDGAVVIYTNRSPNGTLVERSGGKKDVVASISPVNRGDVVFLGLPDRSPKYKITLEYS